MWCNAMERNAHLFAQNICLWCNGMEWNAHLFVRFFLLNICLLKTPSPPPHTSNIRCRSVPIYFSCGKTEHTMLITHTVHVAVCTSKVGVIELSPLGHGTGPDRTGRFNWSNNKPMGERSRSRTQHQVNSNGARWYDSLFFFWFLHSEYC